VLRPQLPNADRLLPYLRAIDETRIYSNGGPLCRELERRLEARLPEPDGAVACAGSGTAALVGAILAVAGRASPERPLALAPSFTFVATAAAAELCGYRLHLVDVDPETWALDPDRLIDHPKLFETGVVIPVAPFGRPVPQAPWTAFRRRTGTPVVIDGAAAFDRIMASPAAYVGEEPVALSFHATKSFGAGEGGAVVGVGDALYEKVARALNFGFFGRRDCQGPSTNGKMSEYHAAIGLAELDGWGAKCAEFAITARRYRAAFSRTGLADRLVAAPDIGASYILFQARDPAEAERVTAGLLASRVEFRLWYGLGVHRHSYYTDVQRDPLPVTESLAPSLIGLPAALDLDEPAIERVAAAVASAAGAS
jgi:dTDP-4-amino-4,6-dideoxygalactose transaminase